MSENLRLKTPAELQVEGWVRDEARRHWRAAPTLYPYTYGRAIADLMFVQWEDKLKRDEAFLDSLTLNGIAHGAGYKWDIKMFTAKKQSCDCLWDNHHLYCQCKE